MPKPTFFNLAQEKRSRILQAAIDEFAGNDYQSASISRLVDRVGIAKGSFYQYFDDKQELYGYLLQLAATEKAEFLEQALAATDELDVFEQLRAVMQRGLQFELSNPGLAQIGARAIYGEAPLGREIADLARQGSREFFDWWLERGLARGEIAIAENRQAALLLVSALFDGLGWHLLDVLGVTRQQLEQRGAAALDRPEYESIVDGIVKLLERALAAPGEDDAD